MVIDKFVFLCGYLWNNQNRAIIDETIAAIGLCNVTLSTVGLLSTVYWEWVQSRHFLVSFRDLNVFVTRDNPI